MNDKSDELCINTVRTLAMDAVQQANSGHPGTPMALAPVVYCLGSAFLRFDPRHPIWPSRDRFVLSAGSRVHVALRHASSGGREGGQPQVRNARKISVTLEDIKRFRQLEANVRATRNIVGLRASKLRRVHLGQGLATSVGMAIAERWLASYFNRPGFELSTMTFMRSAATAA